jgi:HEPN domain-containing protein
MGKRAGIDIHEWLRQAQYDLKSAEIMFANKRYIHTVFMCHLSVEKALKGLYANVLGEMPPKTHNLIYLAERARVELPDSLSDFLITLNGVSIPTRYPDELRRMQKVYNKTKTHDLLQQSKEMVKWLKGKL